MVNPFTTHPHVYKKGKILKFKPLNEGSGKEAKKYVFSSNTANLVLINNHCNNINQILGRTYLGICKLLSYMGLSKDPSENYSKEPSVFNKFKDLFLNKGENEKLKKQLEEIKPLIEKINPKLQQIEDKIEKFKPSGDDKPVSRQEVLDFTEKLKEIQEKLNAVIGG